MLTTENMSGLSLREIFSNKPTLGKKNYLPGHVYETIANEMPRKVIPLESIKYHIHSIIRQMLMPSKTIKKI